jgi:tetratricopeptide (TPR) repeat protein
MDQQDEFAAASELAFTGRYREAHDSLKALLQHNPSHVEALILLGKVEYYLGHPAASRRSFEIALSYEPGNMAAFFGIEYHRQRTGSLFLVAAVVLLLAAIGVATAFVAHRLTLSMRQFDAKLDATSAALTGSVNRMGIVVEELRSASRGEQKDTEKTLSEIRTELEKLRRGNADFMREIEELRKAAFPGYQAPLTVP